MSERVLVAMSVFDLRSSDKYRVYTYALGRSARSTPSPMT